MKKLLLKIGLLTGLVSATFANNLVVMPFTGNINYDTKSTKKSGKFYGLYIKSFKYYSNSFIEMNYEYDDIKYKNAVNDYRQNSLTFIYHVLTTDKRYHTRIGINYLNINDQNGIDKNNYVLIWGNETYLSRNTVGLNVYFSKINKSKVEDAWQLSPYVNVYMGTLGMLGSFYSKLQYNYISLKNKNDIENKKSYNNFDVELVNYNPKGFTTTISASLGKSSYKVDKGGFVFYNTGNVIKYSVGINENISFGKNKDKFLSLGIKKVVTKDYDENDVLNDDLEDYTFSVMFGLVF